MNPNKKVDELFAILRASEHREYFGEAISQLEHALQTAQCARDANAPESHIIAALLHDIGHLVGAPDEQIEGIGVIDHDEGGARYLQGLGFSEEVVDLVRGHVQAKRFLTAINAQYQSRLSPASVTTLELQGGPMSDEEIRIFSADPRLHEKLRLRSWDELAKRTDWVVSPLDSYRSMLVDHLESTSTSIAPLPQTV